MKTRVLYTCREYAQYILQTGSPRIIPMYGETLASHYILLDRVRHGIGFNIETGTYAHSLWKGSVW